MAAEFNGRKFEYNPEAAYEFLTNHKDRDVVSNSIILSVGGGVRLPAMNGKIQVPLFDKCFYYHASSSIRVQYLQFEII